jgi:hypothetical protein
LEVVAGILAGAMFFTGRRSVRTAASWRKLTSDVVYRGCLVMASTRRDRPWLPEGGDTDADAQLRRRHGLEAVRGGEDAVAVYKGAAAELPLVDRVAPRYVAQRRHELVLAVGYRVAAHDLRLQDPAVFFRRLLNREHRHRRRERQQRRKTNASR